MLNGRKTIYIEMLGTSSISEKIAIEKQLERFSVGDLVQFDANEETIRGVVVKRNLLSIKVRQVNTRNRVWTYKYPHNQITKLVPE